MNVEVRCGSITHRGRVRARNEDAILAGPTVFAVADGMGGHAGGDVASALAVSELAALERPVDADSLRILLSRINGSIRDRTIEREALSGMGTTVTGIVCEADRILVFNVGDSRVYRLRGDSLERCTEDDSLVGEMVRRGELTEEEARLHPQRNVVTRALGVVDDVDPAVIEHEPHVGDRYLVASDGLYNELDDEHLVELLTSPGPLQLIAQALADAALDSGGRDNISAVLVEVTSTGAASDPHLDDDTNQAPPITIRQ